jgi:hypothetical protein
VTKDNGLKLGLRVDSRNQWFVSMWVFLGKNKIRAEFKIDTGCNAMVLSQSTLKRLGCLTDESVLLGLPAVSGALANGEKHTFRKLGIVSLCQDKNQTTQICKAEAICHSTHETHDLLGTEVFRQFVGVTFNLTGNKYMELLLRN